MADIVVITDDLGRHLEIKTLGLADQFDLLEAAQDKAAFKSWFNMATLVFSCAAIDGVPLPTPRKPADFKKNAEILRNDGIAAIISYLKIKTAPDETSHDQVETAKN